MLRNILGKLINRLLIGILIIILTLSPAAVVAEGYTSVTENQATVGYSYEISDNIPVDVQKEAYEYIVSTDTGIVGQKASGSNTYGKLLESYLRYYGIFAPVSQKDSIARWVQDELTKAGKSHIIPEAYVTTEDLTAWVDRYAMPGDLLLYKTNGNADKCLIYVGDGKAIVKRDETYKLLPFPSTYVTGDYKRTKSSGLYAIAHLWKNEETTGSFVNLSITINAKALSFTCDQYKMLEYNPNNGMYEPTKDYIIFEKSPGCYTVWNGEGFGFKYEYITEHQGIHIILENAESANRSLPQRTKVELSMDEIDMLGNDINITIKSGENNQKLWNGKELLSAID